MNVLIGLKDMLSKAFHLSAIDVCEAAWALNPELFGVKAGVKPFHQEKNESWRQRHNKR